MKLNLKTQLSKASEAASKQQIATELDTYMSNIEYSQGKDFFGKWIRGRNLSNNKYSSKYRYQ